MDLGHAHPVVGCARRPAEARPPQPTALCSAPGGHLRSWPCGQRPDGTVVPVAAGPAVGASFLTLAVLASAAQDLVPGHVGDGITTDGSKLLRTPARLRADAEVRSLLSDPAWQDRPDA